MADNHTSTTRICSKCGEEKPFLPEYFRDNRSKCRECGRVESREGFKKYDPQMVQERLRQYRKDNPEKIKEWDRKKYERRIDRIRQYTKERYAKSDKAAAQAALKAWRVANPERQRQITRRGYAKNKAKHLAKAKRWLKNNPEAAAAIRARRRVREGTSGPSYTRDDVRALLKEHGRLCFYCGSFLKRFHVDHFIPLAKGGGNGPENIRLACETCNTSKGAKMPWEWKPEMFSQPMDERV